ncbi:MAG: hypothetical protein KDE53_04675 [Caldilineaceae bacterium]|nr:hypothetical protein [Caldilineaceae bacterium]
MNEQYATTCEHLPDYLLPIQRALAIFVRDAKRRILLEQIISKVIVEVEHSAFQAGMKVNHE